MHTSPPSSTRLNVTLAPNKIVNTLPLLVTGLKMLKMMNPRAISTVLNPSSYEKQTINLCSILSWTLWSANCQLQTFTVPKLQIHVTPCVSRQLKLRLKQLAVNGSTTIAQTDGHGSVKRWSATNYAHKCPKLSASQCHYRPQQQRKHIPLLMTCASKMLKMLYLLATSTAVNPNSFDKQTVSCQTSWLTRKYIPMPKQIRVGSKLRWLSATCKILNHTVPTLRTHVTWCSSTLLKLRLT